MPPTQVSCALPRRTAFFGDVVSGRAAYNPSMVGVVLDGVLIAALLLGRYGTGMWALEMAFDEEHRDLGAGQVLLVLAMEEAIGAGATSLGYLQHFAYFKKRWLAEETEVVSTRVVRRASAVHVRHLVGEAERRLRGPHHAKLTTAGGQDQAVQDTEPTTESSSNELDTRTISGRPARLPDAVQASRQLLLHGSRTGVLFGRDRAERLLPFSLR